MTRELVIRNGLVVDGTGRPGAIADVRIVDGIIADVAAHADAGRGAEVVDADGLLVTPGFVDLHTHYDGQATWDPFLAPSCEHGVTSLVMGNCGVGFAPAHPTAEQHDWLIGMLEGVEDIPGTALAEGLPWDWETFPQYLDALERRRFVLDVGTHVTHAPLRAYVMGERGADPLETPTPDELDAMAAAVREGVEAGALGFTTSRTYAHRTNRGAPLGTRFSSADELIALIGAMGDRGVVQMISDAYLSTDEDFVRDELRLMRSIVEQTRRPLSMTVQQPEHVPDRWREMAGWVDAAVADDLPLRMQVAPRSIGVLQGLQATVNPLALCPSYRDIADLDLEARVIALRDPERRRRLIAEHAATGAGLDGFVSTLFTAFERLFPMGDPVDYEPGPEDSVDARAARRGVDPVEEVLDLLVEDEGRRLLYMTLFNYAARRPLRRAGHAPVAERPDWPQRCRRTLRRDLRRQLPDDGIGTVEQARRGRAAGRADGPPLDAADGEAGRLARSGCAGARQPRRRQRDRPGAVGRPPAAHRARPARWRAPPRAVGERVRPNGQAGRGDVRRRRIDWRAARRPGERRADRSYCPAVSAASSLATA